MGRRVVQLDLFPGEQPSSEEIMDRAMAFNPIRVMVGFSGGDDSLVLAHWAKANIPGCELFSIITGIGVERTITHRREVCARFGWDLLEIDAKRDCGQDYDEYVMKWGFPGPPLHQRFYNRLKGRAIEKMVRDAKALVRGERGWHRAKVAILTGIRQDESERRMGYGGREVNFVGAQMWVNPLYWRSKSWFMDYIREHDLPRNPVSVELGMSGECLCGAFASPGEKAKIKLACPATYARLEALEERARAAGFSWGWEGRPPRPQKPPRPDRAPKFMPMCVGCEKTPFMFDAALTERAKP